MDMNRRSFFKVIGGVAALAAVPTVLIEAAKAIPAGSIELGLIREVCAYDLYTDSILLRHDVLAEGVQLFVDMRITKSEAMNEQSLQHFRGVAKEVLEREMQHRGIAWSDLKPLPMPVGYKPIYELAKS